MVETKRLYRSRSDRMIGGVCAGLAKYLDLDPTVVRLVTVLIVLFTALVPGVIAYLLALLIIPEEPTGAAQQP